MIYVEGAICEAISARRQGVREQLRPAVGGAEDPEKILDQAVNEMQSDLIKMRQSSAQVLASQKQIEAKYTQSRDTAVTPPPPPLNRPLPFTSAYPLFTKAIVLHV